MLSPDLGVSKGSSIISSDPYPTGVRPSQLCEPYSIESERPRLGVMDREEPSPPPAELKYEDAEDEQERGMSRPFMNEEEDEEADENCVDGFRCENGELLRAREDDAIQSVTGTRAKLQNK